MSALARAVLIRCVQVAFSLEVLDATQPLQLSPTSLVELLLCRLLKCGGHARFAIGLLRPIGLLPRIPRTDPNRTGVDNGQDRSGLNPLDSLAHFRVKRWQSPLLARSRSAGQLQATTALPPRADLRAVTSALPPILSASPPGADLPGGPAVGPLLTQAV